MPLWDQGNFPPYKYCSLSLGHAVLVFWRSASRLEDMTPVSTLILGACVNELEFTLQEWRARVLCFHQGGAGSPKACFKRLGINLSHISWLFIGGIHTCDLGESLAVALSPA